MKKFKYTMSFEGIKKASTGLAFNYDELIN